MSLVFFSIVGLVVCVCFMFYFGLKLLFFFWGVKVKILFEVSGLILSLGFFVFYNEMLLIE